MATILEIGPQMLSGERELVPVAPLPGMSIRQLEPGRAHVTEAEGGLKPGPASGWVKAAARVRPALKGRPTEGSRVNPAGVGVIRLRGFLSSARFTVLASVGRPFRAGRTRPVRSTPS